MSFYLSGGLTRTTQMKILFSFLVLLMIQSQTKRNVFWPLEQYSDLLKGQQTVAYSDLQVLFLISN